MTKIIGAFRAKKKKYQHFCSFLSTENGQPIKCCCCFSNRHLLLNNQLIPLGKRWKSAQVCVLFCVDNFSTEYIFTKFIGCNITSQEGSVIWLNRSNRRNLTLKNHKGGMLNKKSLRRIAMFCIFKLSPKSHLRENFISFLITPHFYHCSSYSSLVCLPLHV